MPDTRELSEATDTPNKRVRQLMMDGVHWRLSSEAHTQIYKAIGDTRQWLCSLDGIHYTSMELVFSLDDMEWCIKFRPSKGGSVLVRKVSTFFALIMPLSGPEELYAPYDTA